MKGKGLDNILNNLNKEIAGIAGRTQQGLTAAALLVKARALVQTPIDTGNLRASAYVSAGDTGKQVGLSRVISKTLKGQVEGKYTGGASPIFEKLKHGENPWSVIGYSASYAIMVHEMDRAYRVGNWKFLANAIDESQSDIINIIKRSAKI